MNHVGINALNLNVLTTRILVYSSMFRKGSVTVYTGLTQLVSVPIVPIDLDLQKALLDNIAPFTQTSFTYKKQ